MTAADATHVWCIECDAEEPLDYKPRPGDYPPECERCGSDCMSYVKIEDLDGEPDPTDDDVRDRRPWGGKVQRVTEIG